MDVFGLNHSFFGDEASVVRDIAEILRSGARASERPQLTQQRAEDGSLYWTISPDK